jgi:hypothetical protein
MDQLDTVSSQMICLVRMDRGNGGEICSGTAAKSLCGGTKGTCGHVSTPTLKSVMELSKSV